MLQPQLRLNFTAPCGLGAAATGAAVASPSSLGLQPRALEHLVGAALPRPRAGDKVT